MAGLPQQYRVVAEALLVGGTGEGRNWIVAAGVAGARPWTVVDYVPVYYSPIGAGFATCALG